MTHPDTHPATHPADGSTARAVEHPDIATRTARGKAARRAAPRSGHAVWDPPSSRPDPLALLAAQETTRVQELVPLRHERMAASPFAFYRGAAVIMASDLSLDPRSGLRVQLCGDAHLANFGGFASAERTLVFDINDFDETHPGPFEWDVKRLAASFEIAGRARELSTKKVREITTHCVASYRRAMAGFAEMSNLQTWYATADLGAIVDQYRDQLTRAEVKRLQGVTAHAESKDNLKALAKLTREVDGERRIVSDPPLVVPLHDLATTDTDIERVRRGLHDVFRAYRHSLQPDRRHLLERYRAVDFARKVVGVGSVGTRCWIAYLEGKDEQDPLFLQIKEAERSVLEPHLGGSEYANHGQRVVQGQRLLQASSDILLGWTNAPETEGGVSRNFYLRQLWDWKVSADLDTMSPAVMRIYAQLCGWTLARGHARSGDAVAIAAYLGRSDTFDRALADFAAAYADQNDRDHALARAAWTTAPATTT